MSSFLAPNHRQPVDFVKQDHMELVESLRRKEIKLAYERNASAGHIAYIDKHGSDFYCTEMVSYTTDKNRLKAMDKELLELYRILGYYYEYEDGYTDILIHHKIERLPFDLETTCYDGFWCKDPTRAEDWNEEEHKAKVKKERKEGRGCSPLLATTRMAIPKKEG